MYEYEGGRIQAERLAAGKDHCASSGPVFEISTLVVAGRIIDPDDREKPLTTRSTRFSRVMIYAVDGKYQMNGAVDPVRGTPNAVKHETLFHNAPVLAAGEVDVDDGIIVGVNDRSGTYQTRGMLDFDSSFANAVARAITDANVPIAPTTMSLLKKKARRR